MLRPDRQKREPEPGIGYRAQKQLDAEPVERLCPPVTIVAASCSCQAAFWSSSEIRWPP
jgi:hypothetical protein